MARSPKKTLEEKIIAKQELIESLLKRIESEKKELEAMNNEKKLKDLQVVGDMISDVGLSPQEAEEALKNYVAGRTAEAS